MPQIKCPHCYAELITKNSIPIGTKVSCPKCKSPFESIGQTPDLQKNERFSEKSSPRISSELTNIGRAESLPPELNSALAQSNFSPNQISSTFKTILLIGTLIAWSVLLVAVVLVGVLFILSISNSKNTIEQAAIGAIACTTLVGFYVFTRCVERISQYILLLQR